MTSELFMPLTILLVPIITLVLGYYSKMKPPKKINGTYGYRTRRSMANQEAWDYANKRSSELMIRESWVSLCFAAVVAIISFLLMKKGILTETGMTVVVLVALALEVGATSASIYIVEKELKAKSF